MSAQRLLQALHEFFDVVVRGEDVRRQAQGSAGVVRPAYCTHVSPMRTLDCHCEIDRLLPWHAEREDASPQTGTGRSQHLDPRQLLQPQTRIYRELAHARFDLRAADPVSYTHL